MGIIKSRKTEARSPQDGPRNLATAYSVKPQKRFAKGGVVPEERAETPVEKPVEQQMEAPKAPAPPKPKMQALGRSAIAQSGVFKVKDTSLAEMIEDKNTLQTPKGSVEKEAPAPDAKQSAPVALAAPAPQAPELTQHEEDTDEMEHGASIAAAIMAKRAAKKMMAEGGMVTEDDADLKEAYEDNMLESVDEPAESIDDSDVVSAIRAKMKLRASK